MNKILILTLRQVTKLWFNNLDGVSRRNDIENLITLFKGYEKTRGTLWTIKRIKLIRLCVTRYLCNQPILVSDQIIGLDKEGFPKAIAFLKPYIDSKEPYKISFVLTLLNVGRAIDFKVKPDYSSITNPSTVVYKNPIPQEFLELFVKDFNLYITIKKFSVKSFYFTNKAGPMGKALTSALCHFPNITGEWLSTYAALAPGITDYLKLFIPLKNKIIINKKPTMRKLSIVNDPEAKARVIAIYDYFSQIILEGISKQLFEFLKKNFSQDRTFTQDPKIDISSINGNSFHSYDLSSATDRFPLELQKSLFTEMSGSKILTYHWAKILTSLPFESDDGLKRYSVGQPMGARTSWTMFTISHHLIVQYAAYLVGIYPFKEYILLGDDIVIYNDKVALEYKKLILGLGVEISETKSHVSKDTYEFAKRWFHKGVEVTGVPIQGFISTIKSPIEMMGLIINLYNQGRYPDSSIKSYDLVFGMLKHNTKSSRERKYVYSLITNFHFFYRLINHFNYEELREWIAHSTRNNGDYVIPNDPTVLLNEFNRIASSVVNASLFDLTRQVSKYNSKLIESVNEILPLNDPSDDDRKLSLNSPVFIALYNSVSNVYDRVKLITGSNTFIQLLECVSLIDINNTLIAKKRPSVQMLFQLSIFGIKVRKEFKDNIEMVVPKPRIMMTQRMFFDLQKSLLKNLPDSLKP